MPLKTNFEESDSSNYTPESQSHSTESMKKQGTEDVASTITSNPSEERDRKQFTLEIHRFMAEIGKPLSKIPIMGYKELDLFQLFKEVTAHGGFNEVVKNVGTWSKIWKRLDNFDPSITDSSFRLKKNYERYLLEYEFKCFPEHKVAAMEFQERSSMKRSSSANSISSLSRPHSPTSSSNIASGIANINISSNTSSSNSHTSPEASRGKEKSKPGKKKQIRKTPSRDRSTPSRSNSFNSTSTSSKFPMVFGDLTIECLGNVIPRFPYVVNQQIFPVGFTSSRYFRSKLNPEREVKYTSQIVDAGERPQFVVTAIDDTDHPYTSFESPSVCWRSILQHFLDLEETNSMNDQNSQSQKSKLSVSGKLRFGLTHPEVAALIEDLPKADIALQTSGSMSPSSKRKYQSISDDDEAKQKAQKYGDFFSARRANFASRDEMDDLESAVATLQGLKHCSVY